MDKKNIQTMILLHLILMVYSVTMIFSKMAADVDFMSVLFVGYYVCIILLLAVYAIAWQQIIKRMVLTVAFANKAITVVWGIIWGFLFFQESISIAKMLGAIIIMAGIVIYSSELGDES